MQYYISEASSGCGCISAQADWSMVFSDWD